MGKSRRNAQSQAATLPRAKKRFLSPIQTDRQLAERRGADEEPKSAETNQISLLQLLSEGDRSVSSSDSLEVRQYVDQLKLQSLPHRLGLSPSEFMPWSADKPVVTEIPAPRPPFFWQVKSKDVESLKLPGKQEHSGAFDWIGKEQGSTPKYLWDNQTSTTVHVTPEILKEGYIAVSWTWGRFQQKYGREKKSYRLDGTTEWDVPKVSCHPFSDDVVQDLIQCLKRVSDYRYFWVDVLCINQKDVDLKKAEIAKQSGIFGAAAGVLCYLWTLNNATDLSNVLHGLGGLLHRALLFGDDSQLESVYSSHSRNGANSHKTHFESLQGDHWFSSLWALQEIVLAPAGVWLTRKGHTVYLNEEILTTQRMAMIMRLLSWSEKTREQIFLRAKHDFLEENRRSEQWLNRIEEHENRFQAWLNEEVRQHGRCVGEASDDDQMLSSSSFAAISGRFFNMSWSREISPEADIRPSVVVQFPSGKGMPKRQWIFQRNSLEERLKEEIRYWTNWAFGTASIDVSLKTTRAAILVAGRNRDVVRGNAREEALLAALKVQPQEKYLDSSERVSDGDEDNRHLSAHLMNALIEEEGRRLFNVAHCIPKKFERTITVLLSRPSVRSDSGSIIWRVEKHRAHQRQMIQYQQRRQSKWAPLLKSDGSILTDMSPDTASAMNSQVLHFTADRNFKAYDGPRWTMLPDGALHIPEGTTVQVVKKVKGKKRSDGKKNFEMAILPNGVQDFPYKVRDKRDLKNVSDSQSWLTGLLGRAGRPQFLFLPLEYRKGQTASVGSHASSGSNRRHTIGIVLVAKRENKNGVTPLCWHKFGTYSATDLDETKLASRILVTSWLQKEASNIKVLKRRETAKSLLSIVSLDFFRRMLPLQHWRLDQ